MCKNIVLLFFQCEKFKNFPHHLLVVHPKHGKLTSDEPLHCYRLACMLTYMHAILICPTPMTLHTPSMHQKHDERLGGGERTDNPRESDNKLSCFFRIILTLCYRPWGKCNTLHFVTEVGVNPVNIGYFDSQQSQEILGLILSSVSECPPRVCPSSWISCWLVHFHLWCTLKHVVVAAIT